MPEEALRELVLESRRHADAVSEQTQKSIQLLAESISGVDAKVTESRRHFDVVSEQTQKSIQLLAESMNVRFDAVHSRIDDVQSEMRDGFAETKAMIRFSHADLDRRVRSLEDTVASLQARVERLESTAH